MLLKAFHGLTQKLKSCVHFAFFLQASWFMHNRFDTRNQMIQLSKFHSNSRCQQCLKTLAANNVDMFLRSEFIIL